MHGRLGIVLSAVTVLTFILGPVAINGQGQNDCVSPNFTCSPTSACNNQERWQLKHRMPSAVGQAQQVNIADMLTWPDPQNIADKEAEWS
jgi:hypothetical protein